MYALYLCAGVDEKQSLASQRSIDHDSRQLQLPPAIPGMFILASVPRPKTSCAGMIAHLATEVSAARIMVQWIDSSFPPRYASVRFRSS